MRHGLAAGGGGFPRHRAAASLKPRQLARAQGGAGQFSAASGRGLIEARRWPRNDLGASCSFSAASGRGLIEALTGQETPEVSAEFSAASGRGLIEAASGAGAWPPSSRFPRHRAAASLKRRAGRSARSSMPMFSAASGRGLIEAARGRRGARRRGAFSAASGRGLIEATTATACTVTAGSRFSAASGRGLIEARGRQPASGSTRPRFPRHRAAASLKQAVGREGAGQGGEVFRGIGPRPH